MSTSVFVTGATGFIAQHIVKLLISHGYNVVGAVRSAAKGDTLKTNLNSDKFSYEIVPDMGVEGAFDKALEAHPEVTVFLHTASPLDLSVTDFEKELIIPAIEGTKNALSAVKKHGPQIKRVVITSSYASMFTLSKEYTGSDIVINEESWNQVTRVEAQANSFIAYLASKKFAEEAAWDFIKTEKPNFVLTTVHPTGVFGPQAFDSEVKDTLNATAEMINGIFKLNPGDELQNFKGGCIDVRDIARAHLIAFEKDEAKNQRLLVSEDYFDSQDFLDIINDKFAADVKGKIPVGKPGSGREMVKCLNTVDNAKTRKILGFKFIGLEKSVVDAVQQIKDVRGKLK